MTTIPKNFDPIASLEAVAANMRLPWRLTPCIPNSDSPFYTVEFLSGGKWVEGGNGFTIAEAVFQFVSDTQLMEINP